MLRLTTLEEGWVCQANLAGVPATIENAEVVAVWVATGKLADVYKILYEPAACQFKVLRVKVPLLTELEVLADPLIAAPDTASTKLGTIETVWSSTRLPHSS